MAVISFAAVLVWLNYKNAYEYWNEQRGSLNKEVSMLALAVLSNIYIYFFKDVLYQAVPGIESCAELTLSVVYT